MVKKLLRLHCNSKLEVTLNLEGFAGFAPGDVMEVSPADQSVPEEERLLLKVPLPQSPSTNSHPNYIYIETNLAKAFHLAYQSEVNVVKVDAKNITLDSVEVMFKHQYLSRSVMWRMKSYLVNECVHLNKQLSFSNIHCSVFEMWRAGKKTSSGLIGPHTKIVYRSASSQIFIFLQMSSEMWDFDINGDLYFEKAVTGFLADLFKKWKQLNCQHDVTIVMFSRTFYKAADEREFPEKMKGCLQQDYKGRFYEDFYRVVVQNERYEDWGPVLALLMRLFNEYEKEVVRFHESSSESVTVHGQERQKVPKAYNSTASQGNFLEVLNISLNVFDKHNVDRSFDRTGQLSIVISPGAGVFEVEFDLTNLTKQRIIDNGIGSDLVCLGEQPLHAVPLFKFHCKDDSNSYSLDAADVYNMPHWINLSFYTTPVPAGPSSFIPRIKMPNIIKSSTNASSPMAKCPLKNLYTRSQSRDQVAVNGLPSDGSIHSIGMASTGISNGTNVNTYSNNGRHGGAMIPLDYDEYDAQIFKVSQASNLTSTAAAPAPRRRRSVINDRHPQTFVTPSGHAAIVDKAQRQRRSSENFLTSNTDHSSDSSESSAANLPSSNALSVPNVKNGKFLRPSSPLFTYKTASDNNAVVSSSASDSGCGFSSTFGCGSYPPSKFPKIHAYDDLSLVSNSPKLNRSGHRPKALINPFDPSQITIKLTSNRRRWTHVFPLDASGIFMQQHHYKPVPGGQIGIDGSNNGTNNVTCTDHHQLNSETNYVPVTSTPTQMRKISTSISGKNTNNGRNGTADDNGSSFWYKNNSSTPRTSASNDGDGKNMSGRLSVRVVETRSDTMTYAWGATGEQEWTPAITTTMDWKSLVMPACLPITTDFFPDAQSLQNDYQTTTYSLLPEDQGAELLKFVCYRGGDDLRNHKPVNIQQVLEELVCQRLQQGFQLILLPRDIKNFGIASDNNLGHSEYTLSIGNIFHRLHILDKQIQFVGWKPRHAYPSINIHYCYRFRAPDNQTYGVSWVNFLPEKLENYKWNIHDNYICMRGEDYEYEGNLKFWRFRLLVLPNILQSITARITEVDDSGKEQLRCLGAYRETNHTDRMLLFTGFTNFFAVISKVLKLPFAPPANQHLPTQTSPMPKQQTSKRHSLPATHPKTSIAPRSPRSKESGNTLDLEQLQVSSPNSSPKTEKHLDSETKNNPSPLQPCKRKITVPSDLHEVASMIKSLPFILKDQKGLLPYSFVSASAILWSIETFESINSEVEAMSLFKLMHKKELICHASGDRSVEFICGFYLYHVVCPEYRHSSVDLKMFQKDWMECEMCLKEVSNTEYEPVLPTDHAWHTKELAFNQATLDLSPVEVMERHDRVEWVHLRYHNRYDPGQAFEIDLDWLVATGNHIADAVKAWTLKAASYKLHLVPIPNDPFALPLSSNADPLRGPIYIDLNLEALPDILKDDQIVQFREKILSKWGFLPYFEPGKSQIQYVHVSGSIFVMVPRKCDRSPKAEQDPNNIHETYINKHFSRVKQEDNDSKQNRTFRTGLLWSWNYMITRRWKSRATGDESFMRRVMEDFKQFCSNNKNRLLEFYNEQFKEKNLSTSSDSSHSSLSDLSAK